MMNKQQMIDHLRENYDTWAQFPPNTSNYIGWEVRRTVQGVQLTDGSSVITETDAFPPRHKHYDMIVAKASNMQLVLLVSTEGVWYECDQHEMPDNPACEYFLCVHKHKDAVLNVLNGGRSEAWCIGRWANAHTLTPWQMERDVWYMRDDIESRIVPRVEPEDGCWYLVVVKSSGVQCVGVYREEHKRFDFGVRYELAADVRVISEMVPA